MEKFESLYSLLYELFASYNEYPYYNEWEKTRQTKEQFVGFFSDTSYGGHLYCCFDTMVFHEDPNRYRYVCRSNKRYPKMAPILEINNKIRLIETKFDNLKVFW
jgi:hypothetical protein